MPSPQRDSGEQGLQPESGAGGEKPRPGEGLVFIPALPWPSCPRERSWSDTEPRLRLPEQGQPLTRAPLVFILPRLAAVPLPNTRCGAPGTRPRSQPDHPTGASRALEGAKGAGLWRVRVWGGSSGHSWMVLEGCTKAPCQGRGLRAPECGRAGAPHGHQCCSPGWHQRGLGLGAAGRTLHGGGEPRH